MTKIFVRPKQNDRLRDISHRYAVAIECFEVACKYGVNGDAYDALWAIVAREAKAAEEAALP